MARIGSVSGSGKVPGLRLFGVALKSAKAFNLPCWGSPYFETNEQPTTVCRTWYSGCEQKSHVVDPSMYMYVCLLQTSRIDSES